MPSFDNARIEEASIAVLVSAFQEACAHHDISPDGDEGSDLLTVLTYAFQKGTTTREALIVLVTNLVGK